MLSIIPLILLPLQTLSCGEVSSQSCAAHIQWAVDGGSQEHPEWYERFPQFTGGSLAHASIEDMQLFFYCVDADLPGSVGPCVDLERPCGRQCGVSGTDTFYDYPSCKPDCLFNNGGCPGGVPCHQIIDAVYRINDNYSDKCYKALSNCWGCLKDTYVSGVGTQLEQVACHVSGMYNPDTSQATDTISRTLSVLGGNCQTKCEENRPSMQSNEEMLWRDGMFNCYDNTRSGWSCTCRKCQRHECSIDETGYAVSACDIDTIQDRTQDLKTELVDLYYDHVSNIAGMVPIVGGFVTAGMTTAKGAYGIYKNDKHEVLNGVIADINRQSDQLKDCMDEKIDVLEAEINLNEMQDAWYLFDVAASYNGDDFDVLMSEIKDAWTEHLLVANSEFDNIDQSITYFKTLLLPLQAFVQTFAQVSTDYLKNVYTFEPAVYPNAYFRTIEGFESLKRWATAALDAISKDMDTKSHQIACEDGKGLAAGLEKWKIAFAVANIDPIESYIMMIEAMNGLFELED
jgi:hypothetical protein